ncbi:MAG TPA: histidine phosphatase family protein [Candidatus Acidoferrales bacterium]|nr:histidine phosphatase family protein [Candidatus Acidoferrales bacterium]
MAIYLVRHGETDWNTIRRLQGLRDIGLNSVGVMQAIKLGRRFRGLRISAIITSPLSRAKVTGMRIRGSQQVPVIAENDLREIDHGHWTGMTPLEIAQKSPEEHAAWKYEPDSFRPSSGERLRGVYGRAGRVLARVLATDFRDDVVIVSHGVVNAVLLCAALARPLATIWEIPQPNASAYVLRMNRHRLVEVENLGHV